MNNEISFTFIDLFAGIGGFHIALHRNGGKCVFASEIDKFARKTYECNLKDIAPELFYTDKFNKDINDIDLKAIPDFNVLCAGFPCQPFSNAGLKKGFDDIRGTLFFNIVEIIKHKKNSPPKILLLENVKGLRTHDKGNTLKRIAEILQALNYKVSYEILNSKNFGVPQNRQRLYIVAWLKTDKAPENFNFPYGTDRTNNTIYNPLQLKNVKSTKIADVLDKEGYEKYTISDNLYAGLKNRKDRHEKKGNGFNFSIFKPENRYCNTLVARYYKDGKDILINQGNANPRKLSPKEAGRLQGFSIDSGFTIPVSDTQAWKQFGNSVTIPVIESLIKEIKSQLLNT